MKATAGYYVTDSTGTGLEWWSNEANDADFYYGNSVTVFPNRAIAKRRINASYRIRHGLIQPGDRMWDLKVVRLTTEA